MLKVDIKNLNKNPGLQVDDTCNPGLIYLDRKDQLLKKVVSA